MTAALDSQVLSLVQMKDNQVFEELLDMVVVLDNLVVLVTQKMKDMMVDLDNQVVVEKEELMDGVVVPDN